MGLKNSASVFETNQAHPRTLTHFVHISRPQISAFTSAHYCNVRRKFLAATSPSSATSATLLPNEVVRRDKT